MENRYPTYEEFDPQVTDLPNTQTTAALYPEEVPLYLDRAPASAPRGSEDWWLADESDTGTDWRQWNRNISGEEMMDLYSTVAGKYEMEAALPCKSSEVTVEEMMGLYRTVARYHKMEAAVKLAAELRKKALLEATVGIGIALAAVMGDTLAPAMANLFQNPQKFDSEVTVTDRETASAPCREEPLQVAETPVTAPETHAPAMANLFQNPQKFDSEVTVTDRETASAPCREEHFQVAETPVIAPETHGAGADGDAAVEAKKKTQKFQPVPLLIREFSFEQQQLLYDRAIPHIRNLRWSNMTELKNEVMENSHLQKIFVEIMEDYFINDLKGEVRRGRVAYIGHGADGDAAVGARKKTPRFFDKLVFQGIGNVSPEEKLLLYKHAIAIAPNLGYKNMSELENLVTHNRDFKEKLVKELEIHLSIHQMS